MIICKNLEINYPIRTIEEWFSKCPPQGKLKHWVDGRSAKETAKHWLHTIPVQFLDLLNDFNLRFEKCSPEYVSKIDNYKGNGRNHDLLIIAENKLSEKVVISIESKVDEPFGETIKERFIAADIELKKNPRSKALNRIQELCDAVYEKTDREPLDLRKAILENTNQEKLDLRYQLFTAVAGTIAAAEEHGAQAAVFVVQTFISAEIDIKKYAQNQEDLNKFVEYLSNGKHKIIHSGKPLNMGRLHGNKFIRDNIELYIGKIDIKI